MRRVALRIVAMLALSACLGAVSAAYQGISWLPDLEELREKGELRETAGLTLEELRQALARGAAIIDARDSDSYEREHLYVGYQPPVLNIPPEDTLDEHLDRLMQLQGYPLILYCNSETCDLAEDLYLDLKKAGLLSVFSDVRIYFPGWEGLERTDLPRTSGPDTWTGFELGGEPGEPNAAGLSGDEAAMPGSAAGQGDPNVGAPLQEP